MTRKTQVIHCFTFPATGLPHFPAQVANCIVPHSLSPFQHPNYLSRAPTRTLQREAYPGHSPTLESFGMWLRTSPLNQPEVVLRATRYPYPHTQLYTWLPSSLDLPSFPLPQAWGKGRGVPTFLPLPTGALTLSNWAPQGSAQSAWSKAAPNRQSGEEVALLRKPEIILCTESVSLLDCLRDPEPHPKPEAGRDLFKEHTRIRLKSVRMLGGWVGVPSPVYGCRIRGQRSPKSEPFPSSGSEGMCHPTASPFTVPTAVSGP